jgi:DNA-directed RNA polymerase subunit beta'
VKVGDSVRQGDELSTGTLNPRKLVELRGLGAGRRYLANKLRDVYGEGLDPRHFELVAKNMMKYADIRNPGDTGYLPGQKVEVADLEKSLVGDRKEVPLSQALGATLARGVLDLTPGTILDQNHIDDLASKGIDKVTLSKSGVVVRPLVPGLQTVKLLDKNWVSKLSFNKLRSTLQDAAATGAEAPIHSTDPIASYVMGKEFGEGENGNY